MPPEKCQPFDENRCYCYELRAVKKDDKVVLCGRAVVYNVDSPDYFGFVESVAAGAFSESLRNGDDVVAHFNHDPNYVLGRRSNSTLKLTDSEEGLDTEIYPPDAQWARDLVESVNRGDITGMSFGFRTKEGGDQWTTDSDGNVKRVITAAELRDVSVVTYPWYPQTEVDVKKRYEKRMQQAGIKSGDEAGDGAEEQEWQASTWHLREKLRFKEVE